MCAFPHSQIHFVRLFIREAHISVEKTKTALVQMCLVVKIISCWYDPFLQEENLVTVSHFDFPPRGFYNVSPSPLRAFAYLLNDFLRCYKVQDAIGGLQFANQSQFYVGLRRSP